MTSEPCRFAVLMPWGRVGSNLLFSLLRDSFAGREVKLANEPLVQERDPGVQLDWFRDFYGAADEGRLLVGSKHALRRLADRDALAKLFADLGVMLVRMRRRNLVKVAVSKLRADLYAERTRRETGTERWGVERGRDALPPQPLDPGSFVEILEEAAQLDRALAAFAPAVPTLDIEYEEVRADADAVFRRLLGWLGVEPRREAEPRFVKATPDELARAVPNLAELRKAAHAAGLVDLDAQFDA